MSITPPPQATIATVFADEEVFVDTRANAVVARVAGGTLKVIWLYGTILYL